MLKNIGVILFCLLTLKGQNADKTIALKVHNDARKEVGVKPLIWSDNLEIDAKKYADFLASKDIFEHSEDLSELGQGENLYSTAFFVLQENGEKYFFEKNELTLHSTETGYFNFNALNGISIKWHPISPKEPVP